MRKLLFFGAMLCVGAAVLVLQRLPATPPGLPAEPASTRGLVTQVSVSGAPGGSITIDETRSAGATAVVRVTADTKILLKEGSTVTAARFSDLHIGQVVLIWYTGPVAQSYPVQATASTIAILRG